MDQRLGEIPVSAVAVAAVMCSLGQIVQADAEAIPDPLLQSLLRDARVLPVAVDQAQSCELLHPR